MLGSKVAFCEHSCISTFHSVVQVERGAIFGADDQQVWLPKSLMDDAKVMCPAYLGEEYAERGLVLVGINPGGGKDNPPIRNGGDALVYPAIQEFKTASNARAMDTYVHRFRPNFEVALQSWQIYPQHIRPILHASKSALANMAYLNILPYRCRDNKYPKTKACRYIVDNALNLCFIPIMRALNPSMIVFLGQQALEWGSPIADDLGCAKVTWDRERAATPRRKASRDLCIATLNDWALR